MNEKEWGYGKMKEIEIILKEPLKDNLRVIMPRHDDNVVNVLYIVYVYLGKNTELHKC